MQKKQSNNTQSVQSLYSNNLQSAVKKTHFNWRLKAATVLVLIIFLASCFSNEKNISYDEQEEIEKEDIMTDSSFMKMINMPVHFDSVDYIIFPLTFYKNQDRKSSKRGYDYEKWDYNESYGSYSYENYDEYIGSFYNLIFQNTKTNEIKASFQFFV